MDKKRFEIIDKGNHVIKKDLMTSTVYSYPKEEDSNEKIYRKKIKIQKAVEVCQVGYYSHQEITADQPCQEYDS